MSLNLKLSKFESERNFLIGRTVYRFMILLNPDSSTKRFKSNRNPKSAAIETSTTLELKLENWMFVEFPMLKMAFESKALHSNV